MRAYETEFESTSEPDGSMINMAVTLKLEEMHEARGQSVDAGELTRLAGQLHRVLAKLKPKAAATITPPLSILDHIAARHEEDDEAHEEADN